MNSNQEISRESAASGDKLVFVTKILLILAGILILIVATLVIVMLEDDRSNPDNLGYFIGGGIVAYVIVLNIAFGRNRA